VPASLPSLFHSSRPLWGSLADRNSVPFASMRDWGYELSLPGSISFTRTVPPALPSLFHSSQPLVPSLAGKNTVLPTFVRLGPPLLTLPRLLISLTGTVPPAVPSLFHNSLYVFESKL